MRRRSRNMDIREESERQRFVLSAGLFAGSIALFTYIPSTLNFLLYLKFGLGGIFLFSFAFLFISAAHLKYHEPGKAPEVFLPHKLREFCYDWSINLFGLSLPIVIAYAVAYSIGWRGEHEHWGAVVIILCILVALLSLLLLASLSKYLIKRMKK